MELQRFDETPELLDTLTQALSKHRPRTRAWSNARGAIAAYLFYRCGWTDRQVSVWLGVPQGTANRIRRRHDMRGIPVENLLQIELPRRYPCPQSLG